MNNAFVKRFASAFLAVVGLVLSLPVGAGTPIEVNPGESIKTAIEGITANGTTVLLKSGTHSVETATINPPKYNFTLQGEDGAIVDGTQLTSGRLFSLTNATVVITNLVFQKFLKGVIDAPIAGGNLRVLGCAFNDNGDSVNGPSYGGAINVCQNMNLVIRGCSFSSNKSITAGGAIYTVGDGYSYSKVIQDCFFTNHNTSAEGGAVKLHYSGRQLLANCYFRDNDALGTSSLSAVGAELSVGYGTANVQDVVISNCVVEGTHTLTYHGKTTVDSKTVDGKGANGICAAINVAKVYNSTFTGKTLANPLPGTSVQTIYGGYLRARNTTFIDCVFTNVTNAAGDDGGGRIGFIDVSNSQLDVENCRFTDLNVTTYGVLAYDGNCTETNHVRNTIFAHNGSHAAIDIISHSKAGHALSVDNCTILHSGKWALRANSSSEIAKINFNNCILVGSRGTSTGFDISISNCVESVANRDFVSEGRRNYLPRSTATALIDQGKVLDWMTADSVDLGGRPRVVNSLPDIGCYERQADDGDYVVVRGVASAADKVGEWADAIVGAKAAIESTYDDERVYLKNGTYAVDDTVFITNKALAVAGETAGGVVLDGQGTTRIMYVNHGPQNSDKWNSTVYNPVTLSGLVFTNGYTSTSDGSLQAGYGGGLVFYGRATKSGEAASVVTNCQFINCRANNGGGLAFLGGKYCDCAFAGNVAFTNENEAIANNIGCGGAAASLAMLKEGARPTEDASDDANLWRVPWFDNCYFTNNTASRAGGTIAVCARYGASASLRMSDCRVYDSILNWPKTTERIALLITDLYDGYLTNCVFRQYAAPASNGGYGGIRTQGKTQIVDCEFNNINISYGAVLGASASTIVDRCRFIDNPYYDIGNSVTVRNSLFLQKKSNLSAFYMAINHSQTVNFDNCTFVVGNWLAELHASFTNAVINYRNSIVWSSGDQRLIYNYDYKDKKLATITFTDTLFKQEPPTGGFMNYENKIVSPNVCFRDAANGDYSLRRLSVARDRGAVLDWMTAASVDMNGNPRIVKDGVPYATDASALPDLGCYENQEKRKGVILMLQ